MSCPLPLYGKPNHNHKCRWVYVSVDNGENEVLADCGSGIMWEKYGFWMVEQGQACYNPINKEGYDYTVPLSSFPIMVRMPQQPARSLKPHILALDAYLRHRRHLEQQVRQEDRPQKGRDELV